MTNASLRDVYDEAYSDEDLLKPIRIRPDAISTNRYDDAARLLRNERGRMLEVGGATGRLSIALAPHFDEVVCTDLSSKKIREGQAYIDRHHPELSRKLQMRAVSADEPMPFATASFDVVIASAVIEHVVMVFEVMDEIARICRPGGCLVMTVPNLAYYPTTLGLLFGRLPITGGGHPTAMVQMRKHGWDGHHFHYFTKQSLAALLRHVGFVPEAWTGDGQFAKLRRWHQNFVGNLTVRARRIGS